MAKDRKPLDQQEVVWLFIEYFGPEAGEAISAMLEDPGADIALPNLARLAKMLTDLGADLTATVKRKAINAVSAGPIVENGVVLKYRGASVQQNRIKEAYTKQQFPPAQYPDLYADRSVAETVVIEVTPLRQMQDNELRAQHLSSPDAPLSPSELLERRLPSELEDYEDIPF